MAHSPLLTAEGPTLLHGFTAGFPRSDEQEQARIVLRWLEREKGGKGPTPVLMTQPHGRAIADLSPHGAEERQAPILVPDVDGAEAAGPITPLVLVKSADCVPILAADPELGRCAGLHAGWRGVAAAILPHLLERWRAQGSSLRQVRLAFGPHIRACCFEVRQDCIDRFAAADLTGAIEDRGATRHVSLETVLRTQAARAGIEAAQIDALPYCTDCYRSPEGQPMFASYRRSGRQGVPAGRNLSFIAILPQP